MKLPAFWLVTAFRVVPPRAVLIAVRPGRDRAGREGVIVVIADSGCGMDRPTLDRLFYPFVTTKGEAGNGLGLWVSKGIVDKHHGAIAVRSKQNRGTVFTLFLPLVAAVEELQKP